MAILRACPARIDGARERRPAEPPAVPCRALIRLIRAGHGDLAAVIGCLTEAGAPCCDRRRAFPARATPAADLPRKAMTWPIVI